jgi:hypothetical protein
VRWRKGRDVRELLTNVLEPSVLSVTDALSVYPWRWKVERLFCDLKAAIPAEPASPVFAGLAALAFRKP